MDSGNFSVLDRVLLILFASIFYLLIRFLQNTQDDIATLTRTMDERVERCEVALRNLDKLENIP